MIGDRLLITGSEGQLGRELQEVLSPHYDVFALPHSLLDVTNFYQVKDVFNTMLPNIVIHTAAYTAVDRAEIDRDMAFKVNAFGTRNIALATNAVNAKMCYISTDYVFNGKQSIPYTEFDFVDPQSIYGKSKYAGEKFVQHLCPNSYVVRTSWLYGLHGMNFVKTMLKLAQEQKEIKVVTDQIGAPTYAYDLALFVKELVSTEYFGTYHASNSGFCSWFEFAEMIFKKSGLHITVKPCSTEEFSRPAPRPGYSVLDNISIRANGFTQLRPWVDALEEFLQKLQNEISSIRGE